MSRHRFISWGVAMCCLIVISVPARGGTTMFLKVDGIKGDSQDKAHLQQIEVASFNAGVTQSVAVTAGAGMGSGKATIQPFTITKAIDSSSPQFFLYTCNGKHIPAVVLELVTAGETQQPVLRYTLSDAIVSSVQTSASAGTDKPSEQITFAFSKITIEFMGQNEKGAAGAKQEVMWDLKMQKGASASPAGGGAPDGSAAAAATAAPDAGAAGGAPAAGAGGAAPAGGAPAGAGAAPAAAGDPAAAQPAGTSKTLTRAQRERLKVQNPPPAK